MGTLTRERETKGDNDNRDASRKWDVHGEREQFAAITLVDNWGTRITTARIITMSLKNRNRPNGVRGRLSAGGFFAGTIERVVANETVLVSPNTNRRPG